jgi:CHAT domain-containing protein/uncharacterized protein HemY
MGRTRRRRGVTALGVGAALAVVLGLHLAPGVAQSSAELPAPALGSDAAITSTAVPGATEVHRFVLPPGQIARLELRRTEADVAIVARDETGEVVLAGSTLIFPNGPFSFLLPGTTGSYRLEVRLLPAAERSRYELRVVEQRPANDADGLRLQAQRAYLEGERLRVEGTAASLRRAGVSFSDALAASRRVGDRAGEAAALTGAARVRDALNEKKDALTGYAEALAVYRSLGHDAAVAYLLGFSAVVQEQLGDRRAALALLDEALPLARAARDRRVEGLTLNNLGLVNMALGELDVAQRFYEEALAAHREAGNPRGEATTLTAVGFLHHQRGDIARAVELMQAALPLRRAIGDPRDLATTLNNLGAIYFTIDRLAEATETYEQAVAAWRQSGDQSGEAATLHNLARVAEASGDYQQSLALYYQALALFRATQSRVREGNTMTAIGQLYTSLGDPRRGLTILEPALAIHEEVGNRQYQASALTQIGVARAALGDPGAALPLYERALELRRQASDRLGEAATQRAFGSALAQLGRAAEALEHYRPATEIYRAISHPRGEATTLVNMAAAHADLGEVERAGTLAADGLERSRQLGDRRGEAAARLVQARLAERRGDLEATVAVLAPALVQLEGLRSRVAVEELRSTFLASVEEYYELEIDALVRLHRQRPADGFAARALAVSESARARALLDAIGEARAGIRHGVDAELLERERRLRRELNAKAARQAGLSGSAGAADRASAIGREIEALTSELQGVDAEIRSKSPRYAALVAPRVLTAEEIDGELLGDDTLLLEFALGRERSYLFAAARGSLAIHDLPARATVETAARRFAQSSRTPEGVAAAEAAGAELSRMVLAPLAGGLERRRLVVVPDGALHSVPWGALPTPGASARRLLAEHELVVLPSASTLALLRREREGRASAPRELAVLADPVFDAQDPRVRAARREGLVRAAKDPSLGAAAVTDPVDGGAATGLEQRGNEGGHAALEEDDVVRTMLDRGTLARLLGSRREAAAILAPVKPGMGRMAVDFDASRETATGRELADFRMVHFATHAVLDDVHPELSGIVLSLVDEDGEAQDGFLRLHEIYNLDLRADLVVLSACETALGKEVRGEGLLGFNRGFMYAGAPRVVSTLWRVDDHATAELMTRFYAAMLGPRRLPPAAALRQAQLSLATVPRWSAPYYWAGFVLQGEWR